MDADTFHKWRQAFSYLSTRVMVSPDDTAQNNAAPNQQTKPANNSQQQQSSQQHVKCNKWLEKILDSSPIVKFMVEELDKVGCKFEKGHFSCIDCDDARVGAFSPEVGVLLCQNRLATRQHTEDTIAHELIHAYDHATVQLDWNNCEHYACSEIRAASLSGECGFTRELKRLNLGFAKHHQKCVRRRASLAVKMVPQCQSVNSRTGQSAAEEAVNSVWKSCFKDTSPFDEIY